jgi:hypothetical protein
MDIIEKANDIIERKMVYDYTNKTLDFTINLIKYEAVSSDMAFKILFNKSINYFIVNNIKISNVKKSLNRLYKDKRKELERRVNEK